MNTLKKQIEKAATSLEFNIKFRKNAEYGVFENRYIDEILSNVQFMMNETNRLICRS